MVYAMLCQTEYLGVPGAHPDTFRTEGVYTGWSRKKYPILSRLYLGKYLLYRLEITCIGKENPPASFLEIFIKFDQIFFKLLQIYQKNCKTRSAEQKSIYLSIKPPFIS